MNKLVSIYKATSLQQGFIYHALSQEQDDAYRVQLLFDYQQELNIENYLKAWNFVIEEYAILRTGFNWEEELVQITYQKGNLNYEYHDISGEEDKEEAIERIQQADRCRAFDLTCPPLFRLHIIKQTKNHYTILKSEHHSISDGWSRPILLDKVHNYYDQLQNGVSILIKQDTVYAAVQEYYYAHQGAVKCYWEKKIQEVEGVNDLNPLLTRRTTLSQFKVVEESCVEGISLEGTDYEALKSAVKQTGVTLNVWVQFAWHKLLQIYTQDHQTIVGTTISGRSLPIPGIETSVGLYINTLPLVIDWNNSCSIRNQLHTIHQRINELNTHSFANLAELQKGGERLFHSLFVFENYPATSRRSDQGLTPVMKRGIEKLDYPLGVIVHENQGSLQIKLKYDGKLLDQETVRQHLEKMTKILRFMIENLETPHQLMSVLDRQEYEQQVYEWNKTERAYPKEKTLTELFEAQVEENPDRIAVVYEDTELSYGELNRRSNQLARHIRKEYKHLTKEDLKPDTLIALCLERSCDIIIAILGVLKAGGAYVPIDPDTPEARVKHMLTDTKVQLLLTQKHLEGSLRAHDVKLMTLDDKPYRDEATHNLKSYSCSSNLAYVIFTSGTTGIPKGTLLTHTSIVNLCISLAKLHYISCSSKILQFASHSFDASVAEIFPTLLSGANLYIISKIQHVDSVSLITSLINHQITIAIFPPKLLTHIDITKKAHSLKTIILSGEAPNISLMQALQEESCLLNGYGPTEVSVCVTVHQYKKDDIPSTIGKPIWNTQVYVVDEHLNPVPIGVIGELYLGGAGLARGYLNRPDLTSERFIPNPFATAEDISKGYTRLYKTGDLVRWLDNGELEYIGRNDHQIKLRGYRIELGEIEQVLSQYKAIKQAVVIPKEKNSHKYLVAYYTGELVSNDELREHLSTALPDYMIPSHFIYQEAFSLTSNGKLDRRALPEPDLHADVESYVSPSTPLERTLVDVWQEVLGLDRIGIKDDFFRIGGDSIVTIQLTAKLRKLGIACHVKDIFEHRTIAKLAAHLESLQEVSKVKTESGVLEGTFGLLPVQKWFFDHIALKDKPYHHWNQSFLIRVSPLDVERLKQSIKRLVEHHDALRLTFKGGEQSYQRESVIPEIKRLSVHRLSQEAIESQLTSWQSDFNIEKGPLWTIGYLEGYEDKSDRIYFAFHHLIVDSVSWRILIEDLQGLYQGEDLLPKTSSYRQWVDTVSHYREERPEELAYWQDVIEGIPTYLNVVQDSKVTKGTFSLKPEETRQLLQEAGGTYHTEVNDLLLTGLSYTLQSVLGGNVHGITLEGHGRELIDQEIDVSRTVGWFTVMYPVKLVVQEDIKSSIKVLKEHLRSIPHKGIGYGTLMQAGELNYLSPISFNYLGQFDGQERDWNIVHEPSGMSAHPDNPSINMININCRVVDEQLRFSVTTKLGAEYTQRITEQLQKNLVGVIAHCMKVIKAGEEEYTPSDFNKVTLSQDLLDNLQQESKEKHVPLVSIYKATSLQQGFIYHALSQEQDDAYRVQLLFDYQQELNIENYLKAWNFVIEEYAILRTGFNWEEELVQITYQKGKLNYEYHDISGEEDKEEAIEKIQQADRCRAFDLTCPPLFRLHIIKQTKNHYTILKSEHHSISDGWSRPILLDKVHNYYDQLQKGVSILIKQDTVYAAVQEYYYAHQGAVKCYWEKKIQEVEGVNDLNPLLTRRTTLSQFKVVEESCVEGISLEGTDYEALKSAVKQTGVTLNVWVQFAWHKLLQIYTQDHQTIVGTTISGRSLPIPGIETSVGLYINTLPLVIDWNNSCSIRNQLHTIHQRINELNTHSFANLAELQKGGERLFHSLFVFENYPATSRRSDQGLTPVMKRGIEKLDYPLGVIVHENQGSLQIKLKYDGKLLDQETVRQHLEKMTKILRFMIENLETPHQLMSVLDRQEYEQQVYEWNKTERAYPKEKTLTELFEAQVEENPDRIAVVYEDTELSYGELNRRSNQLARHIRKEYKHLTKEDLKPDTLIALCLERSCDIIIAILGVLKAGGAYVPIDPDTPEARVKHMLTDTKVQLLLTQKHLEKPLRAHDVKLMTLDDEPYRDEAAHNLKSYSCSSNLAYVIFTSGTTGLPKGVSIEHKFFVSFIWAIMGRHFTNKQEIKTYSLTNYSFDIFGLEYGLPLFTGGMFIIGNNEFHLLDCTDLNFIQMTPSLCNLKIDDLINTSHLILLVGGEELTRDLLQKACKKFSDVINVYGPTETTIWSTSKSYSPNKIIEDTPVSFGMPLDNEQAYVLDEHLNPVPVGVIGELYLGGAGLARGYLNRPDLTSERFIPNPFATAEDVSKGYTRLYKTGDLVRWLDNGELEYIGRNDYQIKLRGYRIELGEIEQVLSQHKAIKQAVVIPKEKNSHKYLVAYYTGELVSNDELREHLSTALPDYMIPNHFIYQERFPLTVSGKLDRRALPEPDYASREVGNDYVAPRSLIEQKLATIWGKILKIEKIGIHDNFFNIGGDSIISIQVVSRARAEGIHFSVKDVFSYPTISGLATIAESSRIEVTLKPDQELTRGEVLLTPIQEWFFKKNLTEYHHFNQAMLLQVSEKLDPPLLRQAFRLLISHHDALRYRYKKKGNSWAQYCVDEASFILDEIDLSHSENLAIDIESLCASIQKGLNINQGPLIKVALIDCGKAKPQRLFVVIHHLIIDGVSWGILIEDLEKIYSALASRKLPTFSPKTHSYQQWSHALQTYAQSKQIEDEIAYWENIDKDIIQLPQDFNRGRAISSETQHIRISLTKAETTNLLQKVPEAYRTQINDILLTSLLLSVGDWTQDYRVSLSLEGHGREDIIEGMDLSHTIGWFTSIFPVNLKTSRPDDIGEAIKEVKETLRQIPHKGVGYGILRYLRKIVYDSYPSLSFNYLGQRDKLTSSGSKFIHAKESYGAMAGGKNAPSHNLIINGRIQDDLLQIDFFYSPNHYQKQTIQELAQNYEKRLRQIISHCSDKNNYGYTPSDFKLSGLGQENLSKLIKNIEEG